MLVGIALGDRACHRAAAWPPPPLSPPRSGMPPPPSTPLNSRNSTTSVMIPPRPPPALPPGIGIGMPPPPPPPGRLNHRRLGRVGPRSGRSRYSASISWAGTFLRRPWGRQHTRAMEAVVSRDEREPCSRIVARAVPDRRRRSARAHAGPVAVDQLADRHVPHLLAHLGPCQAPQGAQRARSGVIELGQADVDEPLDPGIARRSVARRRAASSTVVSRVMSSDAVGPVEPDLPRCRSAVRPVRASPRPGSHGRRRPTRHRPVPGS